MTTADYEFNSREDIEKALDQMFLAGFTRTDIDRALDRICQGA